MEAREAPDAVCRGEFPLCSAGAGEPPQSLAGGQARFFPHERSGAEDRAAAGTLADQETPRAEVLAVGAEPWPE